MAVAFHWFALLFWLGLSFFMSGMEAGVMALNRLRIRQWMREGKPQAVVVQADGTVRFQALKLGEEEDAKLRILDGLQPGDKVVLNPPFGLKTGDRIQGS